MIDPALLLTKLSALEWTEERRPGHPWQGQILVNRKEVEQMIREAANG